MTQISQKQAVVNTTIDILGADYDSTRSVNTQLTADQKKNLIDKMATGILNGDILYSKDITDMKAIRKYAAGMVSNHIRKAKELNGGEQYQSTSSGKGTRDPKLSALKKLLVNYDESTAEHVEIQAAITARLVELKAAMKPKSKKSTILIDDLPQDLKELANTL